VYGEFDEVCFPYFESRRHEHVQQALGLHNVSGAVLLSDGYEANVAAEDMCRPPVRQQPLLRTAGQEECT
jgi:hypothetical protein